MNIRLVNAISIINNIKMVDESISRCRYYIEMFPNDFALKLHLWSLEKRRFIFVGELEEILQFSNEYTL